VSPLHHLCPHSGDSWRHFFSSDNGVNNTNYCVVILKCLALSTTLILANSTELNSTDTMKQHVCECVWVTHPWVRWRRLHKPCERLQSADTGKSRRHWLTRCTWWGESTHARPPSCHEISCRTRWHWKCQSCHSHAAVAAGHLQTRPGTTIFPTSGWMAHPVHRWGPTYHQNWCTLVSPWDKWSQFLLHAQIQATSVTYPGSLSGQGLIQEILV